MNDSTSKLPVRKEGEPAPGATPPRTWHPVESLRQQFDRLVDDFDRGLRLLPFRRSFFDIEPFSRHQRSWASIPAVDVAETDKSYEIVADLPGIDEKDIDVRLANGGLTIRGEKHQEREEKKKDYYLSERHVGSFERYFQLPEGIDTDKIEATFRKGVLTVTLPKTQEAQKAQKSIPVKTV